MELQNIDVETRIWPNLQTVDGSTLQLAPQEIGDVAVSEAPNDPFLRPVKGSRRGPRLTGGGEEGKSRAQSTELSVPALPEE